jgi:hypothetical protein
MYLSFSCHGQENTDFKAKINGLSFVASNKKLVEKDIQSVANINANWVALMPFGFMPSANTPSLSFNTKWQWWGETAKGIKKTSSLFEKRKIKRMLKPQLWIKGGTFTGLISMSNENDWIQLEKNYEAFILHYAKLAQDESMELFCIGTELNRFVTARPDYWTSLIKKIKIIYKGQLTYAANWDTYQNPSFWKALDFIGMDAYFPLSKKKTPSVMELNTAWLPIKKEIQDFSVKNQKPIVFTEFGYRSINFTTRHPWDSNIDEVYNTESQKNGLNSIFETFWQEDWFQGGFLWKWFDNHLTAGGNQNKGFTVQNKESQNTIKEKFKSK